MDILKKPILSEKASILTEKSNRFSFQVDHRANKIEIKKAIEKMYGVSVEQINTMTVYGKKKSRNTKAGIIMGATSKYKKAVVTLKGSETIDLYGTI